MARPGERDPDMRAAEYVLGTLPFDEAKRMERELIHDQALRDEVALWEEQLGQLGLALPPVAPPAEAWDAIRARLHTPEPKVRDERVHPAPQQQRRQSSRLWQGLAMAASVAALVLAGLLYVTVTRPPTTPQTPTYASIFYDQPTATGWFLAANAETDEMSVTAVGDYPMPTGKELRLWIIPASGKPIASGVVPTTGTHSWAMSARVAQLLRDPATAIAVSMEVVGQPVSAGPQGPILWQAQVRQRG